LQEAIGGRICLRDANERLDWLLHRFNRSSDVHQSARSFAALSLTFAFGFALLSGAAHAETEIGRLER
jgi:hypothetical protein